MWHTITVCNQNITQACYGTRTFVLLLSSNEQSGVDETSKFSQSIPHSSKMGSRSVLLYYITKTRAQCPVHISINGRLRYNYGSDTRNMVATISNSSCSVESTSVNNPEKTGRVQKTFKRKQDREPSRIPLHRVIRLLKRRKCRKNIQYLVKHDFPSSSFFRDFCNNYKNWLIRYNCEHFYFKYVYFINKQKGKRGNNLCTFQQNATKVRLQSK